MYSYNRKRIQKKSIRVLFRLNLIKLITQIRFCNTTTFMKIKSIHKIKNWGSHISKNSYHNHNKEIHLDICSNKNIYKINIYKNNNIQSRQTKINTNNELFMEANRPNSIQLPNLKYNSILLFKTLDNFSKGSKYQITAEINQFNVFNSNNSSFSSKIKGIILSKGIRFSRYGNQKARKLSIKLIKDIQQTSTISFKRKINLWTINNPNFHKEKFFKIFSLNSKLNKNNNNNKTYIRISFRNNKIFSNSIVSEISTNGVI